MRHKIIYEQQKTAGLLDEQSFVLLFERYWERVYSICTHYTDNHDDARDLTQAIFLDLWKNREQLDENSNLEHYLSKAARYQSLNYLRNQQTKKKHLLQVDTYPYEPQAHETPEIILQEKETRLQLEAWVAAIPEPSRTVFILHREESLTYREIAEKQKIPLRTVHYHISSALAFLKRKCVGKF